MPTLGAIRIQVRGIVQGVGFRPFVYTCAERLFLRGWVRNTSSGVEIHLEGSAAAIQAFLRELANNPPPLARIDEIQHSECLPEGFNQFTILESQPQPGQFIPISPDMSICPDCQQELFTPSDRRYRYPFINCTNCGPRFSIIQDIPYDRPKTTMAGFDLCPECQVEYENPRDRRFHAQPVACPVCGPQLWFECDGKCLAEREDALQMARQWLMDGKIIAVKGLGGFHLACDASNPAAVNELRRRKKRSDKPFALMAFDLPAARRHASITPSEEALLRSRQRPVVLVKRRTESSVVPEAAPNQPTLGLMLPYTPLHLLLLEPAPGFPDILVMTSGNLSEEPIAFTDEDAMQRLTPLADAFLMHNRPIHMRVDDSVVRDFRGGIYALRRSRGYAPDPIHLPRQIQPILAAGAELKSTFCLTRGDYAFLSHHIGDLENYETLRSYEEGITHYERIFRIQPEILACDLHPNYLSTRYAQQRAQTENLPIVEVQHHHAHLAACLADNHWNQPEPVIGLSLDGTGLGTDGAVWGGEVLLGGYQGYQRFLHLKYMPLPGSDLAIRKPARMALAWLWSNAVEWEPDMPPMQALCYEERTALRAQLEHHLNTPDTSSMGRLFDAVSALIGIRQEATYEGQAAIELEALADPDETSAYEFEMHDGLLDPAPLLQALLRDWRADLPLPIISARFHNGISQALLQACNSLRQASGANTVALSGGVWQNMVLLKRTHDLLTSANFQVLIHRQTPTNDGCIALGQAMITASVKFGR